MANRPTRPWLRLSSISSLAPTPAAPPPRPPAPAPAPVQPTFRPLATQPQEPSPPPTPPPPSAPAPAPAPAPKPAEPTQTQNGERSPPPPQPVEPPRSVTTSVPSSPINGRSTTTTTRTTSSLPTSPTPKIPSTPPKKEETIPPAPLPSRSPPPPASPAPPAPPQTSPEVKPIQPSPGALKKTSSPGIAPQAPPPSPLTLPPSQFQDRKEQNQQFEHKIPDDVEKKTVTEVQNSKSRTVHMPPVADNTRKIKNHEVMHKEKSLSHHHHQHPGQRVITIAGENKGAIMELIRSPRTITTGKGNQHHPPTASGPPHFLHEKSSGKESTSESSSEDDEKQKQKQHLKKIHKFGKGLSYSPPTNAFMNSNVQGINNSIVYNSSCTHNDPGVHLCLTRKPTSKGGGFKVGNNGKADH